MVHPLVEQLRFSRAEFLRALKGLSDEDASKRAGPANCIAWNIGHLAWQEQRYWLIRAAGRTVREDVNTEFRSGGPGTTPALSTTLAAWREITEASAPFLDSLTTEMLQTTDTASGKPLPTTWGNLLQRTIYHYWFHNGENIGLRQALGHTGLEEFVGDIDGEAPYSPH
ncbi:MAG: DinB family protein [Chloroflexota bacterium]